MPSGQGPGRRRASPATRVVVTLAIVAALALISAHSFVLFHSLAEMFAIVIGCSVFLIAWNSRTIAPNDFLLFLGAGYLTVGLVDALHLLAFPGVNVLGEGRGLSSQLWLIARFLEAATLVLAPFFLRRRVSIAILFGGFGAVGVTLVSLLFSGHFPATVVGGRLTAFKSVSEIVIASAFGLSVVLLQRHRSEVDPQMAELIVWSTALRILSELALITYGDPHGLANFMGHVLKVAASYLLYRALVENLLMRPYQTLFRNLNLREVELRAVVSELESFSYSVSHDLRAPLTKVRGYAELLQHDLRTHPGSEGGQRMEFAAQIVQGTERMAEIIEDLLRLGQVSRSQLQVVPVDVTSLCLEVVGALQQSEPNRSVEVKVEPRIHARADSRLLRSALENLIGNAWKFTARVAEPRIEIGLSGGVESEGPALYIRDNGAGFDNSRAASAFHPFTRLHAADEFKGTGIGLAIVHRIVQRHGGRVWAEGEVGKGATFYVCLPGMNSGESA